MRSVVPAGARWWSSTLVTTFIVLALFVLFVWAVKWFRSSAPQERSLVQSIADILKPDPISQAVIDGAIDTQSSEAVLFWTKTGERIGTATRGERNDRYSVQLKASLPAIDREVSYYQVWLLSRLPYDFFSLGEMVTDEEGHFILEWTAPDEEDYSLYSQVIVTLNAYDGLSDPGEHLVEGEFGK